MKLDIATSILYDRGDLQDTELIQLHQAMLYPRMIEEKMLNLLRQGKISKWFSGIGQEAISVGVTLAVSPDAFLFPLHRNLGVFTSRGIKLEQLLAQWQGHRSGFTQGRDRSFHFGSLDHRIVGMISHLGPQLALADGVALATKLEGGSQVTVAFTGEGGTSEGDFHEALNVAAVWKLPVIFVIENNGYALSTPTDEQYACRDLADRGVGYGIPAYTIDGNNVLEVYRLVKSVTREMLENPHPVLIECKTFRMRGHEEASGTRYVPDELMEHWKLRDPITNYTKYLDEIGILPDQEIKKLKKRFKKQINQAVTNAFSEPEQTSSIGQELTDVFQTSTDTVGLTPKTDHRDEMRFIDALHQALDQAMDLDKELVLMGQDIADYGGVFKVTDGLASKYGTARVRNTPLCESAIVGTALGLSLKGYPSMVEMQFADFVSCGFNQIVNNLAKLHYRWGHAPNVTIRMPCGGGVGAGPYHSQSNEAWFFHTPGLKIAYPSNSYDAKGLLMASLRDPNPVLFFEHKYLYRTAKHAVPPEPYTLEFGQANIVRTGQDATCITYGMGVRWAEDAIEEMQIDVEIVDLRTLCPLDFEAIETSVRKTGRVLILHEASRTGGVGAEISSYISEHLFEYLDAPILRVASLDTPVPFAPNLEAQFLPTTRLRDKLLTLLDF